MADKARRLFEPDAGCSQRVCSDTAIALPVNPGENLDATAPSDLPGWCSSTAESGQ